MLNMKIVDFGPFLDKYLSPHKWFWDKFHESGAQEPINRLIISKELKGKISDEDMETIKRIHFIPNAKNIIVYE